MELSRGASLRTSCNTAAKAHGRGQRGDDHKRGDDDRGAEAGDRRQQFHKISGKLAAQRRADDFQHKNEAADARHPARLDPDREKIEGLGEEKAKTDGAENRPD